MNIPIIFFFFFGLLRFSVAEFGDKLYQVMSVFIVVMYLFIG